MLEVRDHEAVKRGRRLPVIVATMVVVASATIAAPGGQGIVREARTVVVDGTKEHWSLVWESKPRSVCGPEEMEMAISCPCSGFAYGERGKLALVRERDGKEIERLHLAPLFRMDYPATEGIDGLEAVLQKWPEWVQGVQRPDADREDEGDPRLIEEIRHREPVVMIRPADYDGDGQATEFLLQVGTLPCGKHEMVAIGVSVTQPHLHALSSAEKPNEPLVMGSWVWSALLAGHGTASEIEWACGDHGSEVESHIQVHSRDGVIHARRWERKCADGNRHRAPPDQG